MYRIIASLFATMILSAILTPFIRLLAFKVGAVDNPNARRVNKVPMPTMGGLAIFLAFNVTNFLLLRKQYPIEQLWALLLAECIILATGIIDDIYELPPKVSVKISSSSNSVNIANTANNSFDLVNKLDVILIGGVSGGGTGNNNQPSTTTESICCIHFNESFKTYIKTLSDEYLSGNGLNYLLQYKNGEMNFRQAIISQFPGIVGSNYTNMNDLRSYMLNNSVLSHAIENNQAYIITNTSSCS